MLPKKSKWIDRALISKLGSTFLHSTSFRHRFFKFNNKSSTLQTRASDSQNQLNKRKERLNFRELVIILKLEGDTGALCTKNEQYNHSFEKWSLVIVLHIKKYRCCSYWKQRLKGIKLHISSSKSSQV